MSSGENLTIIKKAGFVSLSRIINWFGLLLITAILARYLSKSEFASYDQFWLVFNTFFPIVSFAFTSSVYFLGSKENAGEYITGIFWFLSVIGFVLTLFIFLLRFEIARFINNPKFYEDFPSFAFFLFFSFPSLILDAILILKGKFRKLFIITGLNVIAYIGVIIFAIALGEKISFIFSGLSVISIVRFIYTWCLINKFFGRGLKGFKLDEMFLTFKDVLLFTIPLIVGHISALISRQVDKYIIANNFSGDFYATYTIGAKELPIVPLITSSFASVIFPEISKLYSAGKNSDVVQLIKDVVRLTSLFIFPSFSFLLFFSREFIVILFSEKYLESVGIFRIYLFFLPVRILVYSSILSALGKQKIYMLVSFFDLIFNLALGLILVKIFGLIGPAIAVVASTYIEAFIMLFFISKALGGIGLFEILPLKFMMLIFVFSLLVAFFCYSVSLIIQDVILRFVLSGILFSVVYFSVAVNLRRRI